MCTAWAGHGGDEAGEAGRDQVASRLLEQELGFGPSSQREPLEGSKLGGAAVIFRIYINDSGSQQEDGCGGQKTRTQADQSEGETAPEERTLGSQATAGRARAGLTAQPVQCCFVHSSKNNTLGHVVCQILKRCRENW